MLTTDVIRNEKGLIVKVNGKLASLRLRKTRVPPAWTGISVDPDPKATLLAVGYDSKGRKQYLYSPEHLAASKDAKFKKVRQLIEEHEDVRSEIEEAINDKRVEKKTKEAALVAYLIYETGIRPGSNTDTQGEVQAYGATTLQLRHVKPTETGVRLKFIGKKGVAQSVAVTNPFLVEELKERKEGTTSYTTPLFNCSSGKLREFVKGLGSGGYTPKDLRTMRGTILAIDLIGWRKLIPKTKKRRKEVVNEMLDKVAKQLGNTRAVTRSAYVDPVVYQQFTEN